jgi:thiosulfate/3-mercaptopyruvate sulfurtransferase
MTTVPKTSPVPSPAKVASEVLVDADWLEANLKDPNLRVVEVDVSRATYDDGHIAGAVLWDVYRDLKDSNYRLMGRAAVEQLLGRSGIQPSSIVVFYGYAPALGFWLMKLYGHLDARILDCSRDAWRVDGHPWSTTRAEPAASTYHLGEEDPTLRASRARVKDAIAKPGVGLVDVRSESEYRGERFWPSGAMEAGGTPGRIPSAVRQPIDGLYGDRGAFRRGDDLRRVFSSIDLDSDDELITYCTIGGRAATAWFVLTYLLGRNQVRVYDGSWAEWGRIAGTPFETA